MNEEKRHSAAVKAWAQAYEHGAETRELIKDSRNALMLMISLAKRANGVKLDGDLCSIGHYAQYHRDALKASITALEAKLDR